MTNLPIQKSNIIELLDIDPASFDKKSKIIETAVSLVEMRMLEKIAGNLKDEDIEKFQKLLDSQDEEGTLSFLKENNLDITKMVEEETENVKKEIMKASDENLEDL